jgi:ABC-type sugar transport system ATPase subunit
MRAELGKIQKEIGIGDERVIAVRIGKASLNCITGKDRAFTHGQKVYVKFKEGKARLFNRQTGIALA